MSKDLVEVQKQFIKKERLLIRKPKNPRNEFMRRHHPESDDPHNLFPKKAQL